MKMYREAEYGT